MARCWQGTTRVGRRCANLSSSYGVYGLFLLLHRGLVDVADALYQLSHDPLPLTSIQTLVNLLVTQGCPLFHLFFFFNDPAPPEISPFPLHAPLPISARHRGAQPHPRPLPQLTAKQAVDHARKPGHAGLSSWSLPITADQRAENCSARPDCSVA